jgi:hypothetical protein
LYQKIEFNFVPKIIPSSFSFLFFFSFSLLYHIITSSYYQVYLLKIPLFTLYSLPLPLRVQKCLLFIAQRGSMEKNKKNMAKNSYTYTEAETEAQAWLDPSLAGIEIRPWRTIEQELTVAKIVEIEAQKVEGILSYLWWNKAVTWEPAGERSYINNAKGALARAGWAKSQISQLEQEIKIEPLEATVINALQTRLNSIATSSADAICASREAIILFAGAKKHLQDRLNNLPNPLPTNIITPSPFPTTIDDIPSFAIEGTKQAHETIEILNSAGQVLGSFAGAWANFRCDNLQNLKNGRTDIIIRVTNPTTKVYKDLNFWVTINTPEAPTLTTPNPMTITGHPSFIEWNISTSGHTVAFLDETGAALIPPVTPVLFWAGSKKFRVQIPDTWNGTKRYMVRISNWTTHVDEFVSVTANLAIDPKTIPPEPPEGIVGSVDVTSEPHVISWRLKNPKHTVELLDEHWASLGTPIRPTVQADGSFSFQLPLLWSDKSKKYKLRVKNGNAAGGPTNEIDIDMEAKNKKPLKKIGIIKWYDVTHIAEHAKDKKHEEKYKISGIAHEFKIRYIPNKLERVFGGTYYAQVPDEHGGTTHGTHAISGTIDPKDPTGNHQENWIVSGKTPEELTKKIYERLHHINHHKEMEFNAANGIVEEEKKDEKHEHGHDHSEDKKWEKETKPADTAHSTTEAGTPHTATAEEHHHHDGPVKMIAKWVGQLAWGGVKNSALFGPVGAGVAAAAWLPLMWAWLIAGVWALYGHGLNWLSRRDNRSGRQWAKWFGPTESEKELYEKYHPGKELPRPSFTKRWLVNNLLPPLGGVARYLADYTRKYPSHGEKGDKEHAGHLEHTYHYHTWGHGGGH